MCSWGPRAFLRGEEAACRLGLMNVHCRPLLCLSCCWSGEAWQPYVPHILTSQTLFPLCVYLPHTVLEVIYRNPVVLVDLPVA